MELWLPKKMSTACVIMGTFETYGSYSVADDQVLNCDEHPERAEMLFETSPISHFSFRGVRVQAWTPPFGCTKFTMRHLYAPRETERSVGHAFLAQKSDSKGVLY